MKIAFLHQPWSIVRPGEVEADSVVLWTDHVTRRLAQRGHEIICYSRLGQDLPAVQRYEGIEHRRVSGSIDRYIKFAFRKFDQLGLRNPHRPLFASRLTYRHFIMQVARDLRDQDVDVVHVQNTSQFIPILRRALPPHIKIALHMHCEWLTQLHPDLVGPRIGQCDLVIGVSDFLAEKTRRRFPQYADRIRRVYNGADVENFDVPREGRSDRAGRATKRVLYVGRISPEKGIHTLLEAFRIVAQQRDDMHLRVIGAESIVAWEAIVPFCDDPKVIELGHWFRGGYMDHVRTQLAQLPSERVEFTGQHVPHPELPRHYADADIFLFPSVWEEPFGMPLVEAMAAGLPCIATRGGAFPEIVEEGKTGLLVERGNAPSLAEAILRLCDDDDLRTQMGAAARVRARDHFTWDHVADSLLEEYRRAGAGRTSGDLPHESTPQAVS